MKKCATILTGVWLVVLLLGSAAGGQVSPQRLETIRSRLHQAKIFFDKMPGTRREVLSGAAQNMIHLANVSEQQGGRLGEIFNRQGQLRKGSSSSAAPAGVIPGGGDDGDTTMSGYYEDASAVSHGFVRSP